jgi:hypothetical protein
VLTVDLLADPTQTMIERHRLVDDGANSFWRMATAQTTWTLHEYLVAR